MYPDKSQSLLPRFCAVVLGLSISTSAAWGAARSINIPPQAVTPSGGTSVGATLSLPPAGTPSFFMTFVLPRDYTPNGGLTVALQLQTRSSTACQVRLIVPQMVRRRVGAPLVNSLSGLNAGSPTVNIPSGIVAGKSVSVQQGVGLAGQQAGDSITLQFQRQGEDPSDDCPEFLFVHAIEVRYQIP